MAGKLRARRVQIISIAALSTLGIYTLVRLSTAPPSIPHVYLSPSKHDAHIPGTSPARPGQAHAPIPPPIPDAALSPTDTTAATSSPPPILKPSKEPSPAPPGTQHPISYLISAAEEEMGKTVARQSKTLEQAVAEYRRRYGMPPPPRFDEWYAFARERGVRLPDEFDGVADLLTPFWGLAPATVRSRASEALGFAGNALLGVQVRRGAVAHMSGGSDWHRKAVSGMLASFVRHLPDMDLAFNVYDEPRVVVPHDDLARLVARARAGPMAAVAVVAKPKNCFSTDPAEKSSSSSSSSDSNSDTRPRPKGLAPEGGFDHVGTTRFNTYAHQSTWLHSRSSCGPDTPARALDDSERADDLSGSLAGELGFVRNATALSDICLSPSLATSFGFFERPNAFSVVQELFPIFSSSKISSYSDIVYPSPWYWYERVAYDDGQDPGWQDKKAKMYWRGSTTGGYSRNGGWRMHHRQRMVDRINGDGDASQAKILVRGQGKGKGGGGGGGGGGSSWEAKQVARKRFSSLFDVSFSHVGQCDPADCEAQERHFSVKGRTRPETAWRYRHLLDVDGNGFSGRFYAFLRSRSLVYKLSVFREWHADWVRPWVHYVPMSLRGDEWLELVRFFSGGGGGGGDGGGGEEDAEDGDVLGEKLALQGRDWANKALRNEDLEVWFFRLLLEYGRVVDDERERIGFSL